MRERQLNWTYLIIGFIFMGAGIALIFFPNLFVEWLSNFAGLIIGASGFFKGFQALTKQGTHDSYRVRILSFLAAIGQILLAGWIINYTKITIMLLIHIVGYYQLIMGLISLISYGLLYRDNAPRRFHRLSYGIIHIVFAIISFTASENAQNMMLILGVYAIFIGFTYINDGRGVFIAVEAESRMKRRIRFPLPIIFNALLPQRVLRKINQFIEGELDLDEEIIHETEQKVPENIESYTLMQILIHSGSNNLDIIGHMNIVYDDIVYSYGNHDVASRKLLGAIGDGVIVLVDKDEYIDFSVKGGDNVVIEYDVLLNESQKIALEKKLKNLKQDLIPWQPVAIAGQERSYGEILQSEVASAEFFKFNTSKFKTYFVFGTNCVMLSDEIIGISGLDLFLLVGILTPGTYYDYLEKEYQKAGSIIVSRKVHNSRLLDYLETSETYDNYEAFSKAE